MYFYLLLFYISYYLVNNYKDRIKIYTTPIKLYTLFILEHLWIELLQKINKTVTRVGFNKYEITYIINNIKYKLIVKVQNGPCKYLLVLNENDEDVTNMIKPYLGPSNDFHKQVYTPISLGHKELCCLTLDGQEVNFRGYDNLV